MGDGLWIMEEGAQIRILLRPQYPDRPTPKLSKTQYEECVKYGKSTHESNVRTMRTRSLGFMMRCRCRWSLAVHPAAASCRVLLTIELRPCP